MADYPSLSYPTILAHAKRILLAGTALEVRLLRRGPALVGFFNDPVRMADDIANHNDASVIGSYFMSGPVHADMLARIDNHLRVVSKEEKLSATDADVLFRTNITFDLDPIRASGISATDAEHDRALLKAHDIALTMSEWYGWPDPDIIDSGNGAHVRWWVNQMANSPENLELFKACLHKAAATFDDQYVEVDTTGFNASRIWRFPGTIARKGEHMPDRPWRTSTYVSQSGPLDVLTPAQLILFAGKPTAVLQTPSQPRIEGIPTLPRDPKFASLNRKALDDLSAWVPALLPGAYASSKGYRWSSKSIGREYEEDISFTKEGIKDFGVADMGDPLYGKRSPVMLVSEYVTDGDISRAAQMLASLLNTTPTGLSALRDMNEEPQPQQLYGDPNAALGVNTAITLDKGHIEQFMTSPLKSIIDDAPEPVYDAWVYQGVLTLFVALQKSGKSTLMQQIGICALKGLPLFHTLMPCRKPADWVLMYAFEDHKANILAKLKLQYRAICRLHNRPFMEAEYGALLDRMSIIMPNTPEYRRMVKQGTLPDMRDGDWTDTMGQFVDYLKAKHGPDGIIVIDTFDKMTGYLSGTNASIVEVDSLKAQMLMRKAADMKVPMLVTHHQTKGAGRNDGANAESYAAGTFRLLADLDNYVMMMKPNDKEKLAGSSDVKMLHYGRMADVDGTWTEIPSVISYSPKVKRVEDGGFIFKAKVIMPDDANALTDDEQKVYGIMLGNLDVSFSANALIGRTGIYYTKMVQILGGLTAKGKILAVAVNHREVQYCIENSIGHMNVLKRMGMEAGEAPEPRLPNVL